MRRLLRSRVAASAASLTVIAVALAGFTTRPVDPAQPTRVLVEADTPDRQDHIGHHHVGPYDLASPGGTVSHDHSEAPPSDEGPSHQHAKHVASSHEHRPSGAYYELAKPGDRGYPGTPSLDRRLAGSLSEGEGRFISVCEFSHTKRDDPIVHPRRPGASHPHDFFGNTSTDAYSTADALRSAQRTTCEITGDSAAYWTPALYDDGLRVPPSHAFAYYRVAERDPRTIEPFPRGLKMIASDEERSFLGCAARSGFRRVDDPPRCASGETLLVVVVFPDCWDARHLDVPDHRSHMAYAVNGRCPPSHPAVVPNLLLEVRYPGTDGGDVALGSVDRPLGRHADFINAWDQDRLSRLVTECLNANVNCAAR